MANEHILELLGVGPSLERVLGFYRCTDTERSVLLHELHSADAARRAWAQLRSMRVRQRVCSTAQKLAISRDELEAYEEKDQQQLLDIGLVVMTDSGPVVAPDMAAMLVGRAPGDNGRMASLLLKLDDQDRATVARSWNIGARPTEVLHTLAITAEASNRQRLNEVVARLTDVQRDAMRDAIESPPKCIGCLSKARGDAPPLSVRLPAGAHGDHGVFLLLSSELTGEVDAPHVPVDLHSLLLELFELVPAAPDEVLRTRQRRRGSSRSGASSSHDVSGAGDGLADALFYQKSAESDALAEGFANSATIHTASAVVDLGRPARARSAKNHPELGAAVLGVYEETLVVLRANVDVATWVHKLAVYFERSASGDS